jgi:hypothetical protein
MKSNFVFIAWLPWCFPGTWISHSSETPIKSNFVRLHMRFRRMRIPCSGKTPGSHAIKTKLDSIGLSEE